MMAACVLGSIRFPDASRLRQELNEGGKAVGRRLGEVLAWQVKEFYARKHKDNLERLIVTRDICAQKVAELEAEVVSCIVFSRPPSLPLCLSLPPSLPLSLSLPLSPSLSLSLTR
jgi:hypothetical protein